MRCYYDMHIHTALSPCGDNDMTPNNIVGMATICGLDVIAVTDHNTCGNCKAVMAVGEANGITVLPGMELSTDEEVHMVCLFPTIEDALAFEEVVKPRIPPIKNRPDIFGEQRLLDEDDAIVGYESALLINATGVSIEEVLPLCRQHHGTAYPAHIDRDSYSILSSLGDIPPLGYTAAEITADGDVEKLKASYSAIADVPLILSSDAHYLHQIAEASAWLDLPECTPQAVIAALDGQIRCDWGRQKEG